MEYFLIGSLADIFGDNGAFPTILSGILDGLGEVADFFISNTLGQIILCVALIGIVWSLIMSVVAKIHRG